ncbi:MAG: response regulator [Syntrophobacteraceae bacterium]
MAKILIIDDEETIRFAFDDFLKKEGHSVFNARSYEEALEIISEEDLDLVFSDILMEGKGGIEILREIKERNLICPVIMITGYPNIETASEAVRLGAFDYISKPLRRDALLHATKMGLQHKALLTEKETYRQNLDAVFRSVKDAIVTVDTNRTIIAVNDAAGDICSIRADAVGKPLDSLPLICRKICLHALGETLESGKAVEIHRMECGCKDRERQVLNLSVFPLIDGQGSFSGAVLVARDETRLAGLEDDLRERRMLHNMIGKSDAMHKLYDLIDALADVDTTVLITGESGTGKEMVAEALRYKSQRQR